MNLNQTETRKSATLLMTGHTLTLFINDIAVAGCDGNKRNVDALKQYIAHRRGTLTFRPDNITTFPWLADYI